MVGESGGDGYVVQLDTLPTAVPVKYEACKLYKLGVHEARGELFSSDWLRLPITSLSTKSGDCTSLGDPCGFEAARGSDVEIGDVVVHQGLVWWRGLSMLVRNTAAREIEEIWRDEGEGEWHNSVMEK